MKNIYKLIVMFLFAGITLQGQIIYTFTNCGATGRLGPTQGQVNTAYASSILDSAVTIPTQGYQQWIVPGTGIYTIEAYGAGTTNARGAVISGEFSLSAGDTLIMVVGQQGELPSGGNGGTFVTRGANYTVSQPLIIAGGGGGHKDYTHATYSDASYSNAGHDGNVGAGGTAGNGGQTNLNNTTYGGGGGGGFFSNGVNTSDYGVVGIGFRNGATGGDKSQAINSTVDGGFGGGGAANPNIEPAGGGGYSGGGGGGYEGESDLHGFNRFGGGGGSYNAGDVATNVGYNIGQGKVVVTADVPSVSTDSISDITGESATSGGDVISDNTARGVCWGTVNPPTIADSKTVDSSGIGAFVSIITGLSHGVTYYVRAYATNSKGTGYGTVETFTTLKADQTISFDTVVAKIYGDTTFHLAATASSGLPLTYESSDTTVATITDSTVTIVSAGSSIITASQPGNTTYNAAPDEEKTLIVHPKTLTITGTIAANKVYDGNTQANVTWTGFSGAIGSDDVAIDTITGTFADKNAGNNKPVSIAYTLEGDDKGNYNIAQPAELVANITKAELTVTAKDTGRFTNEPNPVFSLEYSGFVADEDESVLTVMAHASTLANASSTAGSYDITVSGGEAQNYTFTYITGILTITTAVSSIASQDSDLIFVYPNPVKDELYIIADFQTGTLVNISDLHGRQVLSFELNGQPINLSPLSPGIYFLRINDKIIRVAKQ